MAVSAIITDPQNEFEETFSIPIATQNFFKKYWIPAIEGTDTEWVQGIRYGIDVTQEEAHILINELDKIKNWVEINLEGAAKEQMLIRIELLITKLPKAFQRKNAIVFIG